MKNIRYVDLWQTFGQTIYIRCYKNGCIIKIFWTIKPNVQTMESILSIRNFKAKTNKEIGDCLHMTCMFSNQPHCLRWSFIQFEHLDTSGQAKVVKLHLPKAMENWDLSVYKQSMIIDYFVACLCRNLQPHCHSS